MTRRLADSVETSLKLAGGLVGVLADNGKVSLYSEKLACIRGGVSYPKSHRASFRSTAPMEPARLATASATP